MKTGYISVPFKAEKGLSQINGIAKFSSAGIIFEFESKLLGLIGDEVKEVRVSVDEILDIRFRRGLLKFFAKIQMRLKNFTKLSQLPNEDGKIKLSIKREDFDLAERAVRTLEETMLGPEMKSIVEETKQELPPAQTSVNELFDTEKLEPNKSKETNKLK